MVIMLYRTNILALLGSESNPIYNKNKVIIWDDYQKKSLSELKFSQNILNLKLRKDKIVVICLDKIYVFSLSSFESIDIIETGENTHGVIGINYNMENTIIAYPDKKKGKIKIKNYEKTTNILVDAHEKLIGNIVLTTICFEQNNNFIAASSSRGTVHIWSLSTALKNLKKKIGDLEDEKEKEKDNKNEFDESQENEEVKKVKNKKRIFNVLPNILGGELFNSEWSFAQVRIKEQRTICTFGKDNTIIIVCSNGKYYKAKIPLEKGGECQIIQEENIFEKS